MLYLINLFTIFLSSLIPKKKNRWIFASWYGTKISDNPKALYDYVIDTQPEIETIWVVQDPNEYKEMNCTLVKKGTLKSLLYQVTAEVAVFSGGYMDFGRYNWLGRTCKIQLWHGVPWKHIELDMPYWKKGLKQKIGKKIYSFVTRYNLYLATSPEYERILSTAVGKDLNIIRAGYPRNALFYDEDSIKACKEAVISRINGAPHTRIISYLPTFRDSSEDTFDFSQKDTDERLLDVLEKNNAVIIQKSHYANQTWKNQMYQSKTHRIITMNDIDCQSLLAATDILITDYSGAYFDFLILNKPVIHFVYDYEQYLSSDRGLYFPKEYVLGGSEAKSYSELVNEIESNLADPLTNKDRLRLMHDRFMTYENSDACRIITDVIKEQIQKK